MLKKSDGKKKTEQNVLTSQIPSINQLANMEMLNKQGLIE